MLRATRHFTTRFTLSGRLATAPGVVSTTNGLLTTPRLAPIQQKARQFSTTGIVASKRSKYIAALVEENGPNYQSIEINTAQLLDTLRNMQSYRSLTPNSSKSPEYRASLRAVSQISGADGGISKPTLTIGELEGVISHENGVTWRMIHEMLKYGFSTELESVTPEMKAAIMFNRVHGFGKVRALSLAEHGARTLGDLLTSQEKEYGRKIAKAQELAINYHKEMELMIPRKEVEMFRDLFDKALKDTVPDVNFEIMGSFRRGEEVSSDIDVVVWHPSFVRRDKNEKTTRSVSSTSIMGQVLLALSKADLLDPDKMFAEGEKKSMFLSRLPGNKTAPHRQVDIRLCPTESLPYMLLGNSGDDMLMKLLRWRAIAKGWTLNEYGMGERTEDVSNSFPVEGTEIIVKDEQEIFDKLGVPYLEPHQRKYAHYRTLKHFKNMDI